MTTTFSYANKRQLAWLVKNDQHIDARHMRKKIEDKQIIMARQDKELIGWIRFGFFWDEIPFMNMLSLEEEFRAKGIGRKLVLFWENEMKKKGYTKVMTSTQSDEEAQHFYRKIGYTDIGSFNLPKEPSELIFIKSFEYSKRRVTS